MILLFALGALFSLPFIFNLIPLIFDEIDLSEIKIVNAVFINLKKKLWYFNFFKKSDTKFDNKNAELSLFIKEKIILVPSLKKLLF
jgi:hypothetical protein